MSKAAIHALEVVKYLSDASDLAATAALQMSEEGVTSPGQVLSIDGGSCMRQWIIAKRGGSDDQFFR